MLPVKRTIGLFVAVLTIFYLLYNYTFGREREPLSLQQRLSHAFPYDVNIELPKYIWQVWLYPPSKELDEETRYASSSWTRMNEDYQHEVLTEDSATSLLNHLYANIPEILQAYHALPTAILRADFLRYLILLARGGVYTDMDTTALKPISSWTNATTEPWGLMVGIESDASRTDWQDWYFRAVQFGQWTIASKPGHPVLVDIVATITEETRRRQVRNELVFETVRSVVDFTGPGVWTDVLFKYIDSARADNDGTFEGANGSREKFTNLQQPLQESDIVVLPKVCFSPDIGQMGAVVGGRTMSHPLVFVRHAFSGSWKHIDDENQPEIGGDPAPNR